MAKNLVIVESPAKCKTLKKFLGKDFDIKASFGHVRDLPAFRMGINISKNFLPSYINIKDKEKVLKELALASKKSKTIYLATDPDREGEAIAWHIQEALKLDTKKVKRIVFSEITKSAVLNAIEHNRQIDEKLVNAQQARRILDRLIGYKLSPLLAKKIKRGLSAGRVQSVAVKLICMREREIQNFVPKEYWIVDVELKPEKGKNFIARLYAEKIPTNKINIENQTEVEKIVDFLKKSDYLVDQIKKTKQKRNPYPPFITSTLQQEASRRFNWTAKKTMLIAQQLYEGIEINGEATGLITYMRTDSVKISDEAKTVAKEFILNKYGKEYLPDKERFFKKTKRAQEAHEAIRPSYINKTPKDLEKFLTKDHAKLYKLIWDRFIASQMSSAQYETTSIIIKTQGDIAYYLKVTDSKKLFDGFTVLYQEQKDQIDDEEQQQENFLPVLKKGDKLTYKDVNYVQKFTQPPPRYTEATLVKLMEEKGIGRPSTYAPTLSVIQDRHYVVREQKTLVPTELGFMVNDKLMSFFADIISEDFTADMENKLDEISQGEHAWQDIIAKFYAPFDAIVKKANEEMEKVDLTRPTDEICEKCGKPMIIRQGRFGEFMACSDYPNCKNAKSIVKPLDINCPKCNKPLVEKRTKRGKIFYGCTGYPDCDYAVWDKPIAEKCSNCDSPILVIKESKRYGKQKYCPKCKTKYPAKD